MTHGQDEHDNEARIEALIERSSLGAPGARQLRARIPLTEGRRISRMAHLWHGGAVPQVDFTRLSPAQFEDMVSVLLSRLTQARRVDGRGGDGGRDCYFSDEQGTDVYELKSFTGRMGQAQRRQVERSLDRAMTDGPRSWTLVVPIDPSPGEERWFGTLKARHSSARLEWLGKTWLNEQLAKFPDITRYFSGAADEVVRLLADINREGALPRDAAGLAWQFAGQAGRLNEIDPYYWFGFTVAGESVTVTAHPRYPDAPRDRPITVAMALQFNDSPGQQEARAGFADFMRFGTPVTIPPDSITRLAVDAPAGLGGEFQGWTLTLDGTLRPGPGQPSAIWLRVPASPPVRRMVRLDVTERSAGDGGLRLLARDQSGLLTLELRFDFSQQNSQVDLTYRYRSGVLPQDAVPALRFCAEFYAAEEMAVTDPTGNVITVISGSFGLAEPEAYIRCAELLAEVQQLCGTTFALPDEFSAEDQRDLLYARAILLGEPVQAEWTSLSVPLAAPPVDNLLSQVEQHGDQFAFAIAVPQTVVVAGGQLPIGTVLQYIPSARITNLAEVRAWRLRKPDGTIKVQLQPGEIKGMTVRAAPLVPSVSS